MRGLIWIGILLMTLTCDQPNALAQVPTCAFLQMIPLNGHIHQISQLEDNIYIAGYFEGYGFINDTLVSSYGNRDGFCLKVHSNDEFVWLKQIGGPWTDECRGLNVQNSGDILLSGFFNFTANVPDTALVSSGNEDVFFLNLDQDGNRNWVTKTQGAGGEKPAFNGPLVLDSLFMLAGGTFGSMSDTPSFMILGDDTLYTNSNSEDVFLTKISILDGSVHQSKRFGGTGSESLLNIACEDGKLFMSGSTGSWKTIFDQDTFMPPQYSNKGFISCLDTNLSSKWLYGIYTDGFGDEGVEFIAADHSGNVNQYGYYQYSSINYRNEQIGIPISNSDIYNKYIIINHLDSSGNRVWTRTFGNSDFDSPTAIACDSAGHIYCAGYYDGTISFSSTDTLFGGILHRGFVCKFDRNGVYQWAFDIPGTGYSSIDALMVSPDQSEILIAGSFTGQISVGAQTLYADQPDGNMFYAKLSSLSGTDASLHTAAIKSALFPNPANNIVQIPWDGNLYERISIFDLSGKVIVEYPVSSNSQSIKINTQDLPNGTYFVKLYGISSYCTYKLSIQH